MIIFVDATSIMRLKVANDAFRDFQSPEQFVSRSFNHEIKKTFDLLFRSHEIRRHDPMPVLRSILRSIL